ncbi:MAG TPA: M14 family zinc carboxypeptidase [bacterium]|nr:M14 family zinc carboxypeptidase [bacterium]
MPVAAERTQPPAAMLLSDETLDARLRRLAESSRVRVERLGHSHEGRPIWAIIIGMAETLERLPYHEAQNHRLAGPRVRFRTLEEFEIGSEGPVPGASQTKVSVLVAGGSFGFEAAHVEALVELAECLATSSEPRVERILERLLIVIIPLMNPDGRAAAIAEWLGSPLAVGHQGSGNAYGFPVNRDFFNLSQLETQAVRVAINRFHPVAAYDPHEDMYHLSHTLPYVCWTPPFARPYHPEIDSRILDCIGRLGGAIAEEWQRRGFNYLYHPEGDHGFLSLFRLGGRLHLDLCLQGVPALITESARRPGSQTWEDRIAQKMTAGLAFLSEVASQSDRYLAARYAVRRDLETPDAFVLPRAANTEGTLASVVEPLLQHQVLVFSATDPEAAYIIPTHQPDGRFVRALLSQAAWNHVALPPQVGATCLRLSALPAEQQTGWWQAQLEPVLSLPIRHHGQADGGVRREGVVIANDAEGIAATNRLLNHGAEVWRVSSGWFGVVGQPRGVVRGVVGEAVSGRAVPDAGDHRIARPRIALYVGQGVDQRHHLLSGSVRFALERLGFPYVPIEAENVRAGELRQFQLLIVPGGWGPEIVYGWEDPEPPWQRPGTRDGLGDEGLRAIYAFVENGGRYLGIGSGGGILASTEFLGLVDSDLVDEMLGEARAFIQVTQGHPLFYGVRSFTDEKGSTIPSRLAVPYYSEPFAGLHGGPIFKAGPHAQVLAEYVAIDDPKSVRESAYFDAEAHTPAILYQPVGRGWAAVFVFEPYLRGVWRSTLPLLANAVFLAGLAP